MNKYDTYYPVDFEYVKQLPEGWKLLPNIAIFDNRNEKGFSGEELLAVTIKRGIIKQSELENKKDISNEDKSNYKLVKKGDIAYNKMRMWQGAAGYSKYRGIVSPAYVVLKPKIKINPKYFHYQFRSLYYINQSKRFSYGICDDQLNLRWKDFKRMYSIVPPIEIQNDIVYYLDEKVKTIDSFIKRKKELIRLLKSEANLKIERLLTKGIDKINFVNTNSKNLKQIPSDWKFHKIKHLSKINPPKSLSDIHKNSTDFAVFLPMENIGEDGTIMNDIKMPIKKLWEGFTYFEKNDIVIAKITPCFENGKGALLNELETKCGFGTTELIVLRPKLNQTNPKFLYHYLHSKRFRTIGKQFMTGTAGQKRISPVFVGNFPIGLPKLSEQNQIVSKIEEIQETLNKTVSHINKEEDSINEYKNALIFQHVSGVTKSNRQSPVILQAAEPDFSKNYTKN